LTHVNVEKGRRPGRSRGPASGVRSRCAGRRVVTPARRGGRQERAAVDRSFVR